MNILDTIEEYLAAKRNTITHDTYVWYECFLRPPGKWCKERHFTDLAQLTVGHIQQFVAVLQRLIQIQDMQEAQVVKGFLSWCAQDEDLVFVNEQSNE